MAALRSGAGLVTVATPASSLPIIASMAPEMMTEPLAESPEGMVAARAINWAHDPLAGGAYSYATPETRAAQAVLSRIDGRAVFFSGEALYRGRDMGTVEAALASGLETARTLLG